MKKLFLIAGLFITSTSCFAQKVTIGLNLPFKDGAIVYEGVVNIADKTKTELYKNAKQWFVDAFNSGKDVIQSEEKEDGKINGRGISTAYYKILGTVTEYKNLFTIQVDVKDGKYRYKMYSMALTSPAKYNSMIGSIPSMTFTPESVVDGMIGKGKKVFTKGGSRQILTTMDEQIRLLIASLNKGMNAKDDGF